MIQVDVVTHFNEDSFSYGLAHGLADRLRQALHNVSCAEHPHGSAVRVSTEGVAQAVNELHVEVHGCCAEVADSVREIVAEVRGRYELPADKDGDASRGSDANSTQ